MAMGGAAAKARGGEGEGGGVDRVLRAAASVVGTYHPVGSFRFVYTIAENTGTGHYIGLSESKEETNRLLELDTRMIWFIHLLLRDHSTDDYRTKVSPTSTLVHVPPADKP